MKQGYKEKKNGSHSDISCIYLTLCFGYDISCCMDDFRIL